MRYKNSHLLSAIENTGRNFKNFCKLELFNECDLCTRSVRGRTQIYHCPAERTATHPFGFDLCVRCALPLPMNQEPQGGAHCFSTVRILHGFFSGLRRHLARPVRGILGLVGIGNGNAQLDGDAQEQYGRGGGNLNNWPLNNATREFWPDSASDEDSTLSASHSSGPSMPTTPLGGANNAGGSN